MIKRGMHGDKQTFGCNQCSRRFFRSDETLDGRAKQIGAAVNMYYDGLSYKRIAENIAEMFDRPEPSKRSIYEWVRRYTDKATKTMREYPAHTGNEWVADEMTLDVGGRKYWNWNVMDSRTRYILASYLSPKRDETAAFEVMRRAKLNSATIPKRIKTDGLPSYAPAIDHAFGGEVKHIVSEGLHAELNNNMSERLQGSFRERSKVMRGLQSRESGQRFLDGWVLNFNVFRPHEGLKGKTPAEAALVFPPFNEWEDLARPKARAFTARGDFRRRRGF
ncbi:MAG: DDE-type integrase/transposase/recombinase [Chloroflexota bacterium]|nr:DDE-type integrase/transposase/recombinase [Chloroflexota bacterium]